MSAAPPAWRVWKLTSMSSCPNTKLMLPVLTILCVVIFVDVHLEKEKGAVIQILDNYTSHRGSPVIKSKITAYYNLKSVSGERGEQ